MLMGLLEHVVKRFESAAAPKPVHSLSTWAYRGAGLLPIKTPSFVHTPVADVTDEDASLPSLLYAETFDGKNWFLYKSVITKFAGTNDNEDGKVPMVVTGPLQNRTLIAEDLSREQVEGVMSDWLKQVQAFNLASVARMSSPAQAVFGIARTYILANQNPEEPRP